MSVGLVLRVRGVGLSEWYVVDSGRWGGGGAGKIYILHVSTCLVNWNLLALAFHQPSSAISSILPDLADDGQAPDAQVNLCFDFGTVMACVELFTALP
jgi:hypothetical protein